MKEGEVTNEVLDSFDGIFACVLSDERTGDYVVARDAMGICPLYWGTGADGSKWFASEMKALQDVCEDFEIFPPVRRIPAIRCYGCCIVLDSSPLRITPRPFWFTLFTWLRFVWCYRLCSLELQSLSC